MRCTAMSEQVNNFLIEAERPSSISLHNNNVLRSVSPRENTSNMIITFAGDIAQAMTRFSDIIK